jgi:hypothetical protein
MRPFGYRRILRASATTILLAVPVVKADQVTVDLGIPPPCARMSGITACIAAIGPGTLRWEAEGDSLK